MIELKDFISETIKQIFDGVTDAQEYAKEKGGIVSPKVTLYSNSPNFYSGLAHVTNSGPDLANMIEFDVAIAASEGTQTKNEVGAKLITVLGASMQGQSEVSSSTVSRIKFVLPIVLPSK